MKKKRFRFQWGAFLMVIFYGGLFFALLLRMFTIQATGTVEGVDLAAKAADIYTKERVLAADRGRILDRNGSIIAEDTLTYRLYAVLSEKATDNKNNPRHVVDPEKTAKILSEYIPMSEEEIYQQLIKTDKDGNKLYQVEFGPAGRNINSELKAKIEKEKLPGIRFYSESKRYYPNGAFASHLIGYAAKEKQQDGTLKTVGKMGLEAYYNDILTGKDGKLKYESDVFGYLLPNRQKNVQEADDGDHIYLTIDKSIQNFLEEAMTDVYKKYKPESMIGIVADAKTGEILGVTQRPTFNPETKEGLENNWLNKITQDVIEPGSTMKTFTLAAAIETGHWHPYAYYRSGSYTVLDRTIRDHNVYGWGSITFLEGFQRSSNTAMANILHEMGNETLIKYLKKFGFGEPTGIDLPDETTGKLLTQYPINYVTTSYGQGSTVTPIQLIQAMTAITNEGNMMQPYFINKIVDGNTGEIIKEGKPIKKGNPVSKSTANQVKELLASTVTSEHGTGRGFKIDGYEVGGKTGTAQIPNPNGKGYMTGRSNLLFSFLGFAPVNDPQIIVYVAVKKPNLPNDEAGSVPVSKVFKPVVQNSLKYLNIKPEDGAKVEEIKMGNYNGKNAEEVQQKLEEKGITAVIIGEGGKIIEQYPKEKNVITKGSIVFLKTEGNITLPSMKNWSLRNVLVYKTMSGLQIEVSGQGYVISQSVTPNTVVRDHSPIVVKLKTPEEKYKQSKSKQEKEDLPKD